MENIVCQHLEAELSAYVDGELKELEVQRVVAHLEKCEGCRQFVDELRAFVRLHRDSHDSEALVRSMNPPAVFRNITATLLSEKTGKLADLFYEIGKVYVLKGARESEKRREIRTRLFSRPKPVGRSKLTAQRLLAESQELSRLNGDYLKAVRRAHSFFRSAARGWRETFETGRRFLEESLSLKPDKPEPRIYLGFYFMMTRRYDQSRDQFRKVLAVPGLSEEARMITYRNIGRLFVLEKKYDDAVSCFEEIERSLFLRKQPSKFLFGVLTSLATAYAKASRYDKSIEYFRKIVKEFPAKVADLRNELCAMETFQSLLRTERSFRDRLERQVPLLFAPEGVRG